MDVRKSLSIAFLAISNRYTNQINQNLFHDIFFLFDFFLTKWPPAAILDGTTMSIIELFRDIWMNNACVKLKERSLNPSKIIALTKL